MKWKVDWEEIWDKVVDFFHDNMWNIITFLLVLVVGLVVVKLTINILRRLLKRTHMEPIAVGFIMAIVKFLLYLAWFLVLLDVIGIGITWIVTAFSAAFLAIGLALQNNIANIANGIIIVSSGMFKKGDFIEVGDVQGSISQINFLYVTIMTTDNKRVTLPNSKILNEVVTNYDSNFTRRVNFEFEVDYENDVEKVKQTVIDCMKSNGMVLLDPAPFCRLKCLGNSNLVFTGRCWCDREDYWSVYFDITETVFNEFKRRGIGIAYDQLEVRQRTDRPGNPVNGSGLPVRVEKDRHNRRHFDLEKDSLADLFTSKRNKKQQELAAQYAAEQTAKKAAAEAAAEEAKAAKQNKKSNKAEQKAEKQSANAKKEAAKSANTKSKK